MNEFSFISFSPTIPTECEVAIPIYRLDELAFFITNNNNAISGISYVLKDGTAYNTADFTNTLDEFVKINDIYGGFNSEENKCFRIELNLEGDIFYSNLLRLIPNTKQTSLIKYSCDEVQFGFNYSIANSYNQIRLPFILQYPQFPQKETVYIDGNGTRKLLSATIDKEYELKTNFMPIDWHEKLIIALGHDNVYIDGVKMQKSGEYEIDYENYDLTDCGEELYQAKAKISKNTIQRNSNC